MTVSTVYTCDSCRKTIVSEDVLNHNEAVEGHAYSRELLTLRSRFLIPVATYEGSRDEWHFCSRECLARFIEPNVRRS